MSSSIFIEQADLLLTMDDARKEIRDGVLFAQNGIIEYIGERAYMPAPIHQAAQSATVCLNLKGQVVIPGLINTHHHMFQSLTRVIPAAQNCELFGWLKTLYPIWAGLTPEMIRISTLTAMAELIQSGCTTSSDHLYIYPNGCRLDDSIEAARDIGMRFHAMRGSMSVGESKGGLPPDQVVENEDAILHDTRRLIETYHDENRYAMIRVGVAPCSPFSVSRTLMRESASLARSYRVGLHTHLAENIHDVNYSLEQFGCTPAKYAEALDWVGDDVWHAHCVQLDDEGLALFSRTHTGIAHCPCSNMRLASGIAPIRKMRDAGIKIGLGVDGSASNDGAHMLAEARQAMLLARVGSCDPAKLTARDCLEMATRGGAQVLQRDDIGYLAPGMSADFVAFDLSNTTYAGAGADVAAALIFCAPTAVSTSVINGKVIIQKGQLQSIDLPEVLTQHRALSQQLIENSI